MLKKLFGRRVIDPLQHYAKFSQQMEKRFGNLTQKAVSPLQSLGTIQSTERLADGWRIHCVHASVSIRFLTPHLLEIWVSLDRQFQGRFSYSIDENFKPISTPITFGENAKTITLETSGLKCTLGREDCRLQLALTDGQIVSTDLPSGIQWNGGEVQWRRELPLEERCYALGQQAWKLNLRGRKTTFWNYDTVHYQRGSDPTYYGIPFYFGLHPKYALGILWDNPVRGKADLGAEHPNQMMFSSEGGELRFYMTAHTSPQEVLKNYLTLTGMPFLPPLWVFGYHQSRYSYTPSTRFRQLAAEFRKRQIPCDVFHFDIEYMDGYRVFTWHPQDFADLPQLLQELTQQGFKSIAILDPGVKTDPQYPAFIDGQQKNIFLKYPDGTLFWGPVWAGESAFPDFTNPQARAWWADQVAKFVQVGFAGVWNDMNEPTLFVPKTIVSTIPDYIPAHWEGQGGNHKEGAHNVYGTLMARASYEGLQKAYPDKRPFTLTRAAYAGAQRYTASWTGDNTSNWDHLRLTISMVLNLGLSGMFFTGPDIGGFHGEPDGELYARWIQLASLLPFCRTHTMKGTKDQEPWSFGREVEDIARTYISLRYQLLPYIYSTYAQATMTGITPIRPTFLYDRDDTNLYEQDDVFMVGDALLVAPILEKGATSRQVYLPRGVWYDFWTRKLIDGERTIEVQAPLDTMPIFAKSGKVLPMYPLMQYIGEKPIDEMQFRAFAGSGETTLYEDAGDGLEYRDGNYSWLYFTNKYLPNGQFGVDLRRAGKYNPSYKKVRLEIVGISAEPERVLVDEQAAALWFYERGMIEILTDPFKTIRIVGKVQDETAAAETVINRSHPELKDLENFLGKS